MKRGLLPCSTTATKRMEDNVQLPDVDEKGPIALQHHGHKEDGEWASSPSLVQFKNIYIRELD